MLSVRDAVAALDSLAGQYVEQMVRLVPLTKARKNKLENKRFQNLRVVAEELKGIFDIDIFEGFRPEDPVRENYVSPSPRIRA